jgi:hypothetical protein
VLPVVTVIDQVAGMLPVRAPCSIKSSGGHELEHHQQHKPTDRPRDKAGRHAGMQAARRLAAGVLGEAKATSYM